MKKTLIILTVLCTITSISVYNANKKQKELDISRANEKALLMDNDSLKENQRVLMLKNEQLQYVRDSFIEDYKNIIKELKIKQKNINTVQYIKETIHKTDTIALRDTIFKNPKLKMDTVIGDEWYNMKLSLRYPDTILTKPEFKSDKYIIVHSKRETIDPPKKFFLLRWFQKKHTVVEVTIKEKNPYIDIKENKMIQFIK